jgi:hypothetical protein
MSERLYSQLTKAISITVILAVISPIVSIVPAQQRPTLRTDRQRYPPSEKVVVYFSGLPAGNDYQITIVTPSHSDNAYGTWYPTEGKTEGVIEDFRSGGDGVYEVRIISLNPDSTRAVHARHIFTVGSAIYTPPAQPSPEKSPAPAVRPQVGGAEVLATGTPELTQRMVTELTEFLEWLLEISLSLPDRAVIKASLLDSWQKNNREEIEGTVQVLELARGLAQESTTERRQARTKLLPDFLTHFRNDKNDAASQMLVKAYDAAHHGQQTAADRVPAPRVTTSPQTPPRPPAPASLPSQPNAQSQGLEADNLATSLAKQVLAGGKDSRDALRSALLTAGFAVRDADGGLATAVKPGQGAVFTHLDIEALAKMSENNMAVPLADLAALLSKAMPSLAPARATDFILQGVRVQARSKFPAMRFWGQFIVALGRHSADSYDLLAASESGKIQVGAVQSALILKELARDLRLLAGRLKGTMPSPELGREIRRLDELFLQRSLAGYAIEQPGSAVFIPAAMRGDAQFAKGLSVAWSPAPCTWDDDTLAPTGDEVALGLGYGFGELMDYLENNTDMWKSVGKVGAILGVANVLLAYIKLVFIYSALTVNIEMDGTRPLVRTKNRKAGEPRQLTAKVELKGSPAMLNCLRQVINMIGLDFDLPADGPLEGAGVEWVMVEGSQSVNTKGDYSIKEAIVEFENSGPRIQQAGASSRNISNFTQTRTDGKGQARIGVLGAPQNRVFPDNALPFNKKFRVRVNIQVEPPKIRGTLSDALGIAAGGPAGLLTLPAELLLKTRWASSPTFTFSLTDWEECQGGWNGTITYSESRPTNDNSLGLPSKGEWLFTANVDMKQATSGQREFEVLTSSEAIAMVDFKSTLTRRTLGAAGSIRTTEQTTATISGKVDARVMVRVPDYIEGKPNSERNYELIVQWQTPEGTQTTVELVEGGDRAGTSSYTERISGLPRSFRIQGTFDLKDRNRLSGSSDWVSKYGNYQYKVTWYLQRCN